MVTNLLSLPIYITRDTSTRFMMYARRRGDMYVNSYTCFRNSALRTIVVMVVLIIVGGLAVISATFLRNNTVPATESKLVIHVGILKRPSSLDPLIASFKRGLAERGFRDGEQVIYDEPVNSGDEATLEAAAGRFVDQKKDLIFAVGDMAAQAVKKSTVKLNIPTVFYANFDPVEDGLIKGYANSENNLVGVGDGAMVERQLELLRRIVPTARTVGVMSVPADGTNQNFISALKSAAPTQNLEVREEVITNINDVPRALDALRTAGINVVYLAPSAITSPRLEYIAQEALVRKMILIGNSAKNAEAGAVFALMADLDSVGRQLAAQADQIFRGTLPSQISSQFPLESFLALNLKTAAALNLTIPSDIIERADVRY